MTVVARLTPRLTLGENMNKSHIRKVKKERDDARRKAERLEQQAEGKSQFMREHLMAAAQRHRDEERACNAVLGRHA